MAIKTVDKVIDGVAYKITQFPGRDGLRIKTELIKLLAPTLFSVAGIDTKLETVNIGQVIESLCVRLDEGQVESLVLRLLACTRREGQEITDTVFDMAYAANYGELFKAVKAVIEVNYGSFFQQLGIGNQKDQALMPDKAKKTA